MKEIEALYSAYKDDVYRYLIALTHDPSLSEDIMQDTFVEAILSIHRFRGDSSVKTWLLSIARKLWIRDLRRRRPHMDLSEAGILPALTDFADAILDAEVEQKIIQRVHALLGERSETEQAVMRMRFAGCSYAAIGQALHISESSARVLFFRTRNALKSILKEEHLIE